MKKSDDKLKLQALDYAERHKIVNSKSIKAFVDGYRANDNETSFQEMLQYIVSKWDHTKEHIETEYQTYLAYSGQELAENNRNELYNQKHIALKCKEALEIFKKLDNEK
ncbi:hypothetical protein [Elizabethkingia anophelis]|uniref:hypothetical protein n=1 Tax=Elizabethkingia anophelis TaxID=1117645 RepID=UPI000DD825C0|nr:hypothetical protein [Elizabethkingia anophelis]MDV3555207.1 hypothetical protein [Elizabethkingia anophelis]MDV3636718.1 hypothetical protein [Elizabethkingia anophelis]MDV3734261.1 hypothetical protein [Elizabethkingia anophelis]RBA36125.1 hypothetical protein DSC50_01900 [Elizabethkingia anophelis]